MIRQRIKHHSRRHFATAAVLLVAVSIDGIDGLQAEYWSGAGCNYAMVSPADQPNTYRLRF